MTKLHESIGENSPAIRAKVSERVEWLGVKVHWEANARKAYEISATDTTVPVFIVPTNEETMIAKHTINVLGQMMGNA